MCAVCRSVCLLYDFFVSQAVSFVFYDVFSSRSLLLLPSYRSYAFLYISVYTNMCFASLDSKYTFVCMYSFHHSNGHTLSPNSKNALLHFVEYFVEHTLFSIQTHRKSVINFVCCARFYVCN